MIPDVDKPPVSREGNNDDDPMSSELADEGENIFKAEGDIIVEISSVLTTTQGHKIQ